MIKILKYLSFFVFVFLFLTSTTYADEGVNISENDSTVTGEELVTVYFFDDKFCPVCQETKSFVFSVIDDYPNIEVELNSITDKKRLEEVANLEGVDDYRVMAPMIFVRGELIQFNDFGPRQKEVLIKALEGAELNLEKDKYIFSIPFIDYEINVEEWSLVLVTVTLGVFDGFNVCSLGALMLILSLVMALNSRKLIFLYGGLFLVSTAVVYGALVFFWGQLFEALLGQLSILRYIVGIAAGAGAYYFFTEFWRFYRFGPTCESSNSPLARKATEKISLVLKDSSSRTIAIVSSIVFFAFAITLIELPCSIGIPVAFTGILIERGVSLGVYTGYVLLYILFYLLDEMAVFFLAVMTKKLWFANSKMVTIVTLAGALVLTYISLYYLFG
jgi:hypothetical protein